MDDLEQASFADLAPPGPRRGEYLVPDGALIAHCASCQAEIVWTHTAHERPIPLSVATIERRDGQRWALSHFADCPQAQEWSRKT